MIYVSPFKVMWPNIAYEIVSRFATPFDFPFPPA